MGNIRRDGTRSTVLALSLALGGEWTIYAQGPSRSTGSGVGTGAGAGAMSSANTGAGGHDRVIRRRRSGSMSGRGPGSPMDSGTALPLGPRRGTVPFGPGVDVSFPTDPYLVPFLLPEEAANPIEGKTATEVTSDLLEKRPGDRRPGGTEPGLAADRQRSDRQQSTGPGPPHARGGHHRRLAGERTLGPRSAPDRPGRLAQRRSPMPCPRSAMAGENHRHDRPPLTMCGPRPPVLILCPKYPRVDRHDPDRHGSSGGVRSTWPRSSATRRTAMRCSTAIAEDESIGQRRRVANDLPASLDMQLCWATSPPSNRRRRGPKP